MRILFIYLFPAFTPLVKVRSAKGGEKYHVGSGCSKSLFPKIWPLARAGEKNENEVGGGGAKYARDGFLYFTFRFLFSVEEWRVADGTTGTLSYEWAIRLIDFRLLNKFHFFPFFLSNCSIFKLWRPAFHKMEQTARGIKCVKNYSHSISHSFRNSMNI